MCARRQLQGAAFLATFSLGALCDCFVVLDRVTIGWDTSAHERILAEAVQRARDALSVVQQAAAVGATHFLAYSTLMCLVAGIFKRLVVSGAILEKVSDPAGCRCVGLSQARSV